eukprot:1014609-Alexandrium_andersonii.AAC.1
MHPITTCDNPQDPTVPFCGIAGHGRACACVPPLPACPTPHSPCPKFHGSCPRSPAPSLSLIHISEPTRLALI